MSEISSRLTFNADNTKAEITLFGTLGAEKDGHSVADAIAFAGEEVGEIEVRINSLGGSVAHGLSVVAAIQNTPATVTGKVVGVAASMAAVVALSCDRVQIVDFGRIMIHDPHTGKEKRMSKKMLNAIEATASQIAQIISNKSGMSEEGARKVMKKETWYNAQEALQDGLVDEVVTTKKKELLTASVEEILNMSTQNTNDMKNVIALATMAAMFEGLSNEATEEEAKSFLEGLKNDLSQKDTTIADLQAKVDKAPSQETLDSLQAQVDELVNYKAEKMVDEAVDLGKIEASHKSAMIETAKKDLQGFADLMKGIPAKSQKIKNQISVDGPEGRKEWTFDDWQKKDPQGLEKMKSEQPESFEKLFNAYVEA